MSQPQPLWTHQEECLAYALEDGVNNFGLFHEAGTGKSGTATYILRHLYQRVGHLRKTLIFSPIVTLVNWKNEIHKFSRVKNEDVIVLNKKTGAAKLNQLIRATRDQDGYLSLAKIIICNYEVVQSAKLYKALLDWQPEILVCDESHRVKSPQGVRSKLVCQLADRAKHRYILTGTPILKNSQDIFFQYRIMDGGATFGESFYAFRNKYFVDKNAWMAGRPGYFPDWQERQELRGEISRKMYFFDDGRRKAHRVLKKDCLDLPPLVRVKIPFELSPNQRRMYDQMKEEFLTYVEEVQKSGQPIAVVANMAMTKALRLQQIACGFVKAEDDLEHPIKDNPRLEVLADLLEDKAQSSKVIVWACFKQNYEDIRNVCRKLKLPFAELHGGITDKDAEMKRFREDPECRVIIANQKSGGIGVNLIESDISIFYSRGFSLEDDLQAEARNYRGGSNMHQKITRYDIIAQNSIDELIAEALETKQNIADSILTIGGKL